MPNHLKKMVSLLSLMLIAALLTGCGASRTPLTAEEFTEKAEAAGYVVQDAADQFPDGAVDAYLLAIKVNDEALLYQIEFAVVPTAEQARAAYHENRATFEGMPGAISSHSSMEIGNFAYYARSVASGYHLISRIDNTFIYVSTDAEYKNEISSFIKDIGY